MLRRLGELTRQMRKSELLHLKTHPCNFSFNLENVSLAFCSCKSMNDLNIPDGNLVKIFCAVTMKTQKFGQNL